MHNIIRDIFYRLFSFDAMPNRNNMVCISHDVLYGQKFKAILLSSVQYMSPLGQVKRPNRQFLIFLNPSTFFFRVLGKYLNSMFKLNCQCTRKKIHIFNAITIVMVFVKYSVTNYDRMISEQYFSKKVPF